MMPDFGPLIVAAVFFACVFFGLLAGVVAFLFTNERLWLFGGLIAGAALFVLLLRPDQ